MNEIVISGKGKILIAVWSICCSLVNVNFVPGVENLVVSGILLLRCFVTNFLCVDTSVVLVN